MSKRIVKPSEILQAINDRKFQDMLFDLVPHHKPEAEQSYIVLGDMVGKGAQCQVFDLKQPKVSSRDTMTSDAVVKVYPLFPIAKPKRRETVEAWARANGTSGAIVRQLNTFLNKNVSPSQALIVPQTMEHFRLKQDKDIVVYHRNKVVLRCCVLYVLELLLQSYVRALIKNRISPHFIEAFGYYSLPQAGHVIMEKAHGTLNKEGLEMILKEGGTDGLRSLLFQVGHAILCMQVYYKMVHYDLNLGNIFWLITSSLVATWRNDCSFSDVDVWRYQLNERVYRLRQARYLFKVGDFGFGAKFSQPAIMQDQVYTGEFTDRYNIAPKFQRSYDVLFFLACIYFHLYFKWQPSNSLETTRKQHVVEEFQTLICQIGQKVFRRGFVSLAKQKWDELREPLRGRTDKTKTAKRDLVFNAAEFENEFDRRLTSFASAYSATVAFFETYFEQDVLRPKECISSTFSPWDFLTLRYFDKLCTRWSDDSDNELFISHVVFTPEQHFPLK